MALTYSRGHAGGSSVTEVARLGAMAGLLFGGLLLILYGAWDVNPTGLLADFLFNMVRYAAAGATIGYVHGRNHAPAGA